VKVDNCTFNNSNDAHILLGTSDGENNTIEFCRFEAGNNTTAIRGTTIAVDGGASDNAQYSLVVRDPGSVTRAHRRRGSRT
jgi:predicted HTH transcriptional regulator